jgi:hypothetical protein
MIERAEVRSAAIAVLSAQHFDDRRLERCGEPADELVGDEDTIVSRAAAGLDEATAHGRLEAAEAEVERLAEPGTRQRRLGTGGAVGWTMAATVRGDPGLGSDLDRGTAGVRQPEHPADLVEASPAASSTVRPSSR